jgi:hypothetical protein
MDVSIASYYIEKKRIKVPKWGSPKNINIEESSW